MTRKLILKASAAALALTAALAAGPAWADGEFKALEGIEASPLGAAEMEAVQGRSHEYFYEGGFASLGLLVFMGGLQLEYIYRYPGTNYYYHPMSYGGYHWYERRGNEIALFGTSNWYPITN